MSALNPQFLGDANFDAFRRIRVSPIQALFSSKLLHDDSPIFWDESTTGAGSTAHSTADARVRLSVTSGTDSAIRQTFQRTHYQPGKSQLMLMTGVLNPAASTERKMGLYDGTDGVGFRANGTTVQVFVSKGASLTTTDQSAWSIDPMDGTGPSGLTLDFTKVQIFGIDFEWLGVGQIRYFFVSGGIPYLVHVDDGVNTDTSVYMGTPNLPMRWEITSSGSAGTLDQICSAVASEGGSDEVGLTGAVSTQNTHIDANTADTRYPIVGMRLKGTHLDAIVRPTIVSVLSETTDDFRWILCRNPTTTGTALIWADETNRPIQRTVGTSGTTISSEANLGEVLAEGYVSVDVLAETTPLPRSMLSLGAAIDSTRDEFFIVVQPLSANSDIQASLSYVELT